MGRRVLPEDLRLNAELIRESRDSTQRSELLKIAGILDVAAYAIEQYKAICATGQNDPINTNHNQEK